MIPLDDKVLQQVLRYHIAIPVPYLVITNGSYCAAFEKINGSLSRLERFPPFL